MEEKFFTVFNKSNQAYLKHPEVGLWFTKEKKEAEDIVLAAKEYVSAIGMHELGEQFEIVEISKEFFDSNNII